MSAKPWGHRSLSDEVIRAIAQEGRAIQRGSRMMAFKALAQKHGCGASTVGKIVNGWILPRKAPEA